MTPKKKKIISTEIKNGLKVIYVMEHPNGAMDRMWYGRRPHVMAAAKKWGCPKWYRFVESPRKQSPKKKET